MYSYLVRVPFRANAGDGQREMKRGEAVRLSSSSATMVMIKGLVVEMNVGLDLMAKYEDRVKVLIEVLEMAPEKARMEAMELVKSCLKRHESLKTNAPPSDDFLSMIDEFNREPKGGNPITKVQAETGVGEWAGYNCNIGKGCSHGCVYCYAEGMAKQYKRVESSEEWRQETLKEVSTKGCKRYDAPIMFPTSHDITPAYLPAYRVHLYNILNAGNEVIIVSKPHRESIEALCEEFTSFRDQMTFRFTIGSLDGDTLRIWEPGAPSPEERIGCLKHAFEQGYKTSISAEPLLGDLREAERLYCTVEPYITEDIWFGKMKKPGAFKEHEDLDLADRAIALIARQQEDEILALVERMAGMSKVKWKDSIREVIEKQQQGCI